MKYKVIHIHIMFYMINIYNFSMNLYENEKRGFLPIFQKYEDA